MTQYTLATPIASPTRQNPANPPQSLSTWFLAAYAKYLEGFPTLPTPPFQLRPGVRVVGNCKYEMLAFEVRRVQASGSSPRFNTGALQADLRDLYRLVNELQEWELEHLDSLEEVA